MAEELGFEVIGVTSKKDRFLLKKQVAGESIQILVNWLNGNIYVTINVGKIDEPCLEFACSIKERKIWIGSVKIKEKGNFSILEEYYNHYLHSAFQLTIDECAYWLYTYDGFYDLGELFDEFLQVRGINNALAEWILNYNKKVDRVGEP